MENLIFSINVVLPMLLLLLIGFVLRRTNLINDNFISVANKLCFKVALPVLLFQNIYTADLASSMNGPLILYAVCILLGIVALLFVVVPLFTKDNTKRGVLIQCGFRSNFILFGLPVAQNLFGEEGAAVCAMVIAVIVPLFNVLAVIALAVFSSGEGKISLKGILKNIVTNPIILGAVAAFVLKALPFSVPRCLMQTVGDISKLATPLALLALGGQFKFESVGRHLRYLIFGVATRLVAVPLIGLSIAVALGFRHYELGALLTMLASPVAVSSYTMALEMKGDGELAGALVVFTSAFSILTMFLFIFTLKSLGLI
jgi:predicted permease